MADMTVRELRLLANLVAVGYPGLSLVSIAAFADETESVELLLSIERSDDDAKTVMMRVPRNTHTFEAELRRQIEALPNR
jgi:hypothetical protein